MTMCHFLTANAKCHIKRTLYKATLPYDHKASIFIKGFYHSQIIFGLLKCFKMFYQICSLKHDVGMEKVCLCHTAIFISSQSLIIILKIRNWKLVLSLSKCFAVQFKDKNNQAIILPLSKPFTTKLNLSKSLAIKFKKKLWQ